MDLEALLRLASVYLSHRPGQPGPGPSHHVLPLGTSAVPSSIDLHDLLLLAADRVPRGAVFIPLSSRDDKKGKKRRLTVDENMNSTLFTGKVSISSLPEEVLANVLKWLPTRERIRLRSVCRGWKELIDSPLVWNEMDLSSFGSLVNDESVRTQWVRRVGNTRGLNLWGCVAVSEHALLDLLGSTTCLSRVNLARCNVGIELLQTVSLVGGCRALTSLNLWNCAGVDDDGLTAVASLPFLTEINVGYCSGLTDVGFLAIAKARVCESLNALWCVKLTDRALRALADNCPLRELNVSGCVLLGDSVIHLANRGAGLHSLNLSGCTLVTDAAIVELATRCTRLTYLNLALCKNISTASVRVLTDVCSHLEFLSLEGCHELTDQCLQFPPGAPLKELSLGFCSQITQDGLINMLGRCRSLETLDIRWLHKAGAGVVAALKASASLKSLDCRWCDGISSKRLKELAASLPEQNRFLYKHCKTSSDVVGEATANNLNGNQDIELEIEEVADTIVF